MRLARRSGYYQDGLHRGLTSITAPPKERPELVARFRSAGLTQRETAETLGVTVKTVQRDDKPTCKPREPKETNVAFGDADVVEAELVEEDPSAPPRSTDRSDMDSATVTQLLSTLCYRDRQ